MLVNGARDEFFARTGFPGDQHGRVGACYTLDHHEQLAHDLAAHDHAAAILAGGIRQAVGYKSHRGTRLTSTKTCLFCGVNGTQVTSCPPSTVRMDKLSLTFRVESADASDTAGG